VVRNDKLGDFMLAWPALAMLRQGLPGCGIDVLANAYTEDMARLCPSIDDVIIDPGPAATRDAGRTLVDTIRSRRYDAAILLYATTRIARLLWQARIPCRVAPATKVAPTGACASGAHARKSRNTPTMRIWSRTICAHWASNPRR
jgi:ADP-heptose:LPS heptosyltransferase